MTLDELFPEGGRILLTGGGKEYFERIGVEAIRNSIHSVMMGENIRTQTEPLLRGKLAIVSGALITLFVNGHFAIETFTERISEMSVTRMRIKGGDKASRWIAQWLIGLTGKQVQNVVRSDLARVDEYVEDFEDVIEKAAQKCEEEFGALTMDIKLVKDANETHVQMNWKDIARLTTAIGSQTLALRGSDKSMYGKLFERLILGSILTILGYERVNPSSNRKTEGVFWLSDSRDVRESDATLIVGPEKRVRFDIGFIGPGNSEISKDKLSRWAREIEVEGSTISSTTFIIVDRLPKSGKTQGAAAKLGAEIIHMSDPYWVRGLAEKLGERLGIKHDLQTISDDEISIYLERRLASIPVQDFLSGVSTEMLTEDESALPDEEEVE